MLLMVFNDTNLNNFTYLLLDETAVNGDALNIAWLNAGNFQLDVKTRWMSSLLTRRDQIVQLFRRT